MRSQSTKRQTQKRIDGGGIGETMMRGPATSPVAGRKSQPALRRVDRRDFVVTL
jgi:hypothetical protein